MQHLILLLVIMTLFSCGQNDTKQKELELKERELALKDKEFEMKQKDLISTNISKVDTVKTSSTSTVNLTPDIKMVTSPPQESKLVMEILLQKLYPNNSKYDDEKQLIRKINKSGDNYDYRTTVQKIYYYESGNQLKAVAFYFPMTILQVKKCSVMLVTQKWELQILV